MADCYVCNEPFDNTRVLDHGEHVIQSSLGGNLIATGILCQGCGSNLGGSVDKDIFDALQPIAVLFDLRRDRGGTVEATASITFKDNPDVQPAGKKYLFSHHDGVRPAAPTILLDHAAKSFHFFPANDKQRKSFPKSAMFQTHLQNGYSEIVGTGLEDLAEAITLELEPNSLGILRGVLKVAIAFALNNGVSPAVIRHFIIDKRDITDDETMLRDAVRQYYPIGWVEALYEAKRYATDDFPPNHQLVLFSEGADLYCYVDLFGVIQKYVRLTDKYTGQAIVKRYTQKCPKWVFTPTDWMVRRPKDIILLAREFGIDHTGKDPQQLHNEVLQKASSRPYDIEPGWQLEKLHGLLTSLAFLPKEMWDSHETIKTAHERAEVAEADFGSDYLSTLLDAKLKILCFSSSFNRNNFRISGNDGSCPKGAAAIPTARLEAYQKFRVDAFAAEYGATRKVKIDTRF